MNKNFHRVIFNAARRMRMVVQETARSVGKSTGTSTRMSLPRSTAVEILVLIASLTAISAAAQIATDRSAPANQRATVLVAPNGVPLVNIRAPSAGGVSRNTYRQFDVDANGAILNNSRTNVQTQLGGYVQGNPWLARGSARVIVNEVNSSNPSYLRGFVEVAGPRADVIIANPSGISIDGGGFINANRATLTTGIPQFGPSGDLEGYIVRGGTVSVLGAGLDASTTDSLAILARALHRGHRIATIGLKRHRQQTVALVHADDVICRQTAVSGCQYEMIEAHARDVPEVIGEWVGEPEAEHVNTPGIDHQIYGLFEVGYRLL